MACASTNCTLMIRSLYKEGTLPRYWLKYSSDYQVSRSACVDHRFVKFALYVIYFLFAENPDSVVQSYFSKFEEQWFSYCNEELEKINTFFAGKLILQCNKLIADEMKENIMLLMMHTSCK